MQQFQRTIALIGDDAFDKLQKTRVAVFGLGGVGGYVVEALARSGVGELDLIDCDVISITNLNRQIYALYSTLGQKKTDVAKARALDINRDIKINAYDKFFDDNAVNDFDFDAYDYIVDAIDTVKSKILLIKTAKKYNIPIISSMGTGNKLDPTKFEIADISKTSICPLARVMRTELKKHQIKNVKVLYSKELPIKNKQRIPSSCSFVPSVAGLIIASEVIKDIIQQKK